MTKYLRKNKLVYPPERVILYDDREKKPWKFKHPRFVFKKARLKIGDYTFEGFEGVFAIEKKESFAEIATNISGRYRETFRRFLSEFSKLEHKVIVIQANPRDLVTMPMYGRISYESVIHWYCHIVSEYNIPVMLVGKDRVTKPMMIMKLFELYEKKLMETY